MARVADAAGAGMEDTIKLFFQVQALSKAFSKVKQPWLMFASYSMHHNLLGTTGWSGSRRATGFSRTIKNQENATQYDTVTLRRPEVACTSVNKEWPSHSQRNRVALAASSRCAAWVLRILILSDSIRFYHIKQCKAMQSLTELHLRDGLWPWPTHSVI